MKNDGEVYELLQLLNKKLDSILEKRKKCRKENEEMKRLNEKEERKWK